jgi:hypothetical protein
VKACAGLLLGRGVVASPYTSYHTVFYMDNLQPFDWENSLNAFITSGRQLLAVLGIDNMVNALRAVQKVMRERDTWKAHCEDICKLTGTTQIGNAKQRIAKLMSGASPDEMSKLPEAFHRPPAIWLSGKKKTLVSEGFAPMGVREAERQHRVILPLLIEAWELAEGDENERLEIEKAYRNWSADEFEKELYRTIYKLEEPTLEELLEERISVQAAEFEEWKVTNANARAKAAARKKKPRTAN